MPKKNGFEVLREIRKNSELAEVPVVILSVLGQDKDIEEAKKLGANDYIIKSTVSMEDALDKIMSHC